MKRETAAAVLREHGDEGYSRRRIEKDEERSANERGLGATRQAEALYREYCDKLAGLISADRANSRRPRDVWDALQGLELEDIAERLFKLGLTAAAAPSIGFDRKRGAKNARDVLLWLGDKLSQLQRIDKELEARIGAWGVTLLLNLEPFILNDDKVLELSRSKSLERFRKDVIARAAHNNPYLLPPTERSAPWTGVRQGPLGSQISLVSRRYSEPAVQEAIESGEMRRLLEAINALQDVCFVINELVLNIAKQLPPEIPLPPMVDGLDLDEAKKQKRRFKRARQKAYDYHEDLELAELVADRGPFNVPHDMDFRGRVYGIPHINYQRADHIRGLFLFAKGERLGDDGLPWLKYHAAGCADGNTWSDTKKPSKLDFDGHIAWTDRNLEQLCKIADDLLDGIVPDKQWLPDDPIQFLAACLELKQAIDTTPVSDFITRLPIKFDGCCSGLQHFCALMRSPEGRLANLTASDVAEDFYQEIADRVREDNAEILDGSNDRKIVKQPTQTFFYGAHAQTMGKQIEEALYDLGRQADPEKIKKLAKAIFTACGDLAPAAQEVRKFIGRLAKLYADEGQALCWQTKMGFPVVNEYHVPNIREGIAVKLGWKRLDMNLVVGDKPEIDDRRSRQAATANFIHSFDAAHLHDVVWTAGVYGIRMATVHDCFACLAPRAGKLNHIIRSSFISIHGLSFLLLRDMRAAAKRDLLPYVELPELPMNHGPHLNLSEVMLSRGWT